MPFLNLADLFDEYNEIKGSLSFTPDYKKLADQHSEQIIFCDKSVGNSHFSLIRNKEFEIIFTHRIGQKVHQCCLELNSFSSSTENTTLLLHWGPNFCELRWDYKPVCCSSFSL